jgi:hypothetical protein
MKRGFMDVAATIVKEYPGLTAKEVAAEALDYSSDLSDAADPLQSLATTLDKQVRTGAEQRIKRERVKGVYRFFPTSISPSLDTNQEILVQLSLAKDALEDVDNLVAVDKADNKSGAVAWLVLEGIRANRAYLDRVGNTRKQIELMKKDLM